MPYLVMFWSPYINPGGESYNGIHMDGYLNPPTIPPEACGFRIENEPSDALKDMSWGFVHGNLGTDLIFQSVVYSSANTYIDPADSIEALGPVGACAGYEANFKFVTPLAGEYGIDGDDPIFAGADAFILEFSDFDHIIWLDSLGTKIPKYAQPKVPKYKPENVLKNLPKEWFQKPPWSKNCVEAFGLFVPKPDCPLEWENEDPKPSKDDFERALLERDSATTMKQFRTKYHEESGVSEGPKSISLQQLRVSKTRVKNQGGYEMDCPAELLLEVHFYKAAGWPPGIVKYRFVFEHGVVSTEFERLIEDDGETTILHRVPFPLPLAPKDKGSEGVGPVVSGSNEFTVKKAREDFPSPQEGITSTKMFANEPDLPDNHYKSKVKVQVSNIVAESLSSGWAPYYIICKEPSSGGGLKAGGQQHFHGGNSMT